MVPDCSIFSALAMGVLQSCANSSIYPLSPCAPRTLTPLLLVDVALMLEAQFSNLFWDWHIEHLLQQWSRLNATKPNWGWVYIGSGNGLVPPENILHGHYIGRLNKTDPLMKLFTVYIQLISSWTKWPSFRRRYIQMHFRAWNILYFD